MLAGDPPALVTSADRSSRDDYLCRPRAPEDEDLAARAHTQLAPALGAFLPYKDRWVAMGRSTKSLRSSPLRGAQAERPATKFLRSQ
jgi:hypothetical protein